MPESHTEPIGPVQPVDGPPNVQPVRRDDRRARSRPEPAPSADHHDPATATGGQLAGAYSQLVINPDTHDVVIRIRDAATNRVLSEYPSSEVEHMAMYLKQYSEMLARRRAAQHNPNI